MKPYLIYLNIYQVIECPEKPSREVAFKARYKALEKAKTQFISLISTTFSNKEVVVSTEQPVLEAVAIQVNEKELDKSLQVLRGMDIVSIIDAHVFVSKITNKSK